MVMMPRYRIVGAILVAILFVAACGGGPSGSRPATPTAKPLPAGFSRYNATKLGFDVALAPGWKEAGSDPGSGVSFSGPNGVLMLVHVEQAASADPAAAAGALLFDLTNGSGVSGGQRAAARLADRPATRVAGRFAAGGMSEGIEAYVMIESGRAWALALAGPPDKVDSVRDDFEKMVDTFRLVGTRPSPPARTIVGLPAPTFPELDLIKGPAVVNFFATWCVDCRTEMPLMARRAASSHGRFTLLGVDCCNDNPSAVPGFLKGMGVLDAFRHVAYDNDGHVARAYSLLGPPTTVFLDKDHVLRQMAIGQLNATSLEQGLRAAGAV